MAVYSIGSQLRASATKVTITAMNAANTPIAICEENGDRVGFLIYNNTGNTVYIQYGTTASGATATRQLASFTHIDVTSGVCYTGPLSCSRNTGTTGTIIVTELVI